MGQEPPFRQLGYSEETVTDQLHRELWTSWASLLRSYAAVHSLGREQHAVVEVSDDSILVRYGLRWMRFTRTEYATSEGETTAFTLTENGRACVGHDEDEMDLYAERLASAIITV
ncbi:transcriptional regulator [Terriglobus roseus]|nr:transcriptional regulator [Terriglobus roseus]